MCVAVLMMVVGRVGVVWWCIFWGVWFGCGAGGGVYLIQLSLLQ